jgi:hypothetical protein
VHKVSEKLYNAPAPPERAGALLAPPGGANQPTVRSRCRRRVSPLRTFVAGQIALGCLLALCVALDPSPVLAANEGGVSNFGVRAVTVVPYTVAFASSASGLWLAGRALGPGEPRIARLGRSLQWVGVAFALVLVSTYPYKLDDALNKLHLALAVLLFVGELVVVYEVELVSRRSALRLLLCSLWAAGFVLGAVTLVGALHVLFVAQITMEVGFALLVASGLADLAPRRAEPAGGGAGAAGSCPPSRGAVGASGDERPDRGRLGGGGSPSQGGA